MLQTISEESTIETNGQSKRSSKAADGDEFQGKRILVTGGTRGIGAAIVDRLTAGGGQLITTGRSVQSDTPREIGRAHV